MARGWSLERLAEKVSRGLDKPVHYSTIGRLEQGKRGLTFEWVERIAGAMGVDPVELVSGQRQESRAQFVMDEQVAGEIARTLATVVLDGEEPDAGIVQVVALMLQELTATFSAYPQAYHDPNVARPVIDLVKRKSVPSAS